MIRTFRNKALATFAKTGDGSKLPVKNARRISHILQLLNAAVRPEDMNLPGFRFHGHRGKPKRYSVDVSGNFRITFGWDDRDAIDVDCEDPH